MRNHIVIIMLAIFIFEGLQAQNISKIEQPEFSNSFIELREIFNDPDIAATEKLKIFEKEFPAISGPYERYVLSFWYYPSLYVELGMQDKLLPLLQSGQQEGLFYPLIHGERKWPSYVSDIENREGFDDFIAKNEQLKDEASDNPVNEYFVVLPDAYDESRSYPLMIVLHGGTGSHYQSFLSWQSKGLDKEFITAYFQGSEYRGSFGRRFDPEGFGNILAMYNKVLNEYPVDTSMIFISGPSAGGYRSILLGIKQMIPAAGILLMFPVIPHELDNEFFTNASDKKLRAVLFTGEHDFSIREQKEFAYRMDTAGIANRFIINARKGHEYPDDLEEQIDLSLEFLKMKPEGEERLIR